MKTVSIIIPCYNAQNYICKCLNGLSKQTYRDFNVIIVDDCSNDSTVEVVSEWAAQSELSIQLIKNDKNLGPSLSRYNGAMSCDSPWVTFCDCDDWYEPEFVEKMYKMANTNKCDIVFCGYRNVIGDKYDNQPLGPEQRVISPIDALYLNVDSLCRTFVKRDIYINTPQLDIRNGEDMALIPLLIQNASSVGVLDDVLYNYYIRQGSASLSPSDKMIESLLKSFEHIDKNMDERFFREKEFIGVRNMIYGCLLNIFKYSYNIAKAGKILQDFEKKYPNWANNPMIAQLPVFKRFFVWCARYRLYAVMWLLSRIHSLMLKL